ncbi:hypothetical protein EHV15_34175 [Paenibacillus oralis]|uniref:Uncharacterized protein n=1 Tax=Paenibacillus oralis TaxID=2490856 RepID=A0A3P3T9B8_9BACL|nr:hypothetical protein [Paenibacillus oralis]RRJ54646.1 hypothetical protein EHV15_34175 [Paenibacillus oralis]
MGALSFENFIRPVPLPIIEYQACRQAEMRIPRHFETPEISATYTGKGFIRHARVKGFIYAEVPIDLLEISKTDLAPERMGRLEMIGGTDDPIWVFIDRDMESDGLIYSIMDGNNRAQYRSSRGIETIPAFVTGHDYRHFYETLKNRDLLINTIKKLEKMALA